MNIDLEKFRQIDEWSIDNYTGDYEIWASNRRMHYKFNNKNVTINDDLRKGSYIFVERNNLVKTTATILSRTEFNKIQKEMSVTR